MEMLGVSGASAKSTLLWAAPRCQPVDATDADDAGLS